LVEFIEVRRKKTTLTKTELSLLAGYAKCSYPNKINKEARFSNKSFTALAKAVIDAAPNQLQIELDKQPEKIEAPVKIEKPIYGVMSIEQMITRIKAAGYKVMRRTEGWEEI
jgi:ribosomal protein L9